MIKCENLSLLFNQNRIFNHFDLQVKKGEMVCLSGVSGRGKTTLLKLLQGYLIPDEGTIYIDGEVVSDKNIHLIRQNITWIPQNINLPVNNGLALMDLLNVSGNIQKVEKLLHMLGLNQEMLYQDFQKVSGGEKQRVIIAICLSMNKKIILMDEPTSSLDEYSIQLLINTIRKLEGKTILSASHNQTWLQSSGQVVVL